MTGNAVDLHGAARDPVDGGDDADRKSFLLEHRALFDVNFDVTERLIRRERFFATNATDRLPNAFKAWRRDTPSSPISSRALKSNRAGQRLGAAERRGKAHALFIAERDDLDGERKALAGFVRCLHHFDGGDDPKRAVEPAGIAHGVDVGAKHQRQRSAVAPAIAADDAAERVDAGRHARLAHPLGDQIGCGPVCGPR